MKSNNLAYIKLPREQTQTAEHDKRLPKFYMMQLPEGTVIGSKDLSGGYIIPKDMHIDKHDKNMMIGEWDRDNLEDNAIPVSIKIDGEWEVIRVDVDVLSQKLAELEIENDELEF